MDITGNEFNKTFYLSWIGPNISNSHLEDLIDSHLRFSNYLIGVAINNSQILFAKNLLSNHSIRTVGTIAFPLGGLPLELKIAQIEELDQLGADQIDIVLQMENILDNNFEYAEDEIHQISQINTNKRLCLIINTPWLTEHQLDVIISLISNQQNFVLRTTTGYGLTTSLKTIERIRNQCGESIEIIVSGGCDSTQTALKFIQVGANGLYVDEIIPFIDGLSTLTAFQKKHKETH